LACRKAKEFGYPHELWTTRLLARMQHGPEEGHACLAHLAQGTVCKILDHEEVKPHKVRYYLEQRDPDFAEKLCGDGRRGKKEAKRCGGDHFLRCEAGHPDDRNHRPGPAA
jgi:hypothetical protein